MTSPLEIGAFGTRRLRTVRQTEMTECGLACLAMIASFHSLDIDLGTLRRRHPVSVRGATLRSLIGIAERMGFATRAVKLPLSGLSELRMPAILHWDMNHFVVAERFRNDRVLIHNPDGRSAWLGPAELSPHFTGVALELTPAAGFEPGERRAVLRLGQLWKRVSGLKRAMVQAGILSLVMQAFVLLSPYYMQVAIDEILPSLDRGMLVVIALGFALLVVVNAIASLLRQFVFLSAGNSLSYGISANLARQLLRLPVSWFQKRHVGDVLSRFQSVLPIQQLLTQGAVTAVIDGALTVFTLVVMLIYSLKLAAVALLAACAYLLIRVVSFAFQRTALEAALIARAKEQSTMIESVRGIVTVRMFGHESHRLALWQTRFADAINADVRLGRIAIWQKSASLLLLGLEGVLAVGLAIGMVMDGVLSVGMVFAYLAYKTQFLASATSLFDQFVMVRMLDVHLERLSDIALTGQDSIFLEDPRPAVVMAGGLELRNVSFGYDPDGPPVLAGVDLVVGPGDHVAITGASGGGKSTLVKLILGLLEPTAGEVRIDGKPMGAFGLGNFRSQVGGVLQDDGLFAGSIGENISLFDDPSDPEAVRGAASAAAINDDVLAMPMGYDTLVGDMGSALSGGQKQRVLLARALYRSPRMLVVDEGTSHLDPAKERAVNDAIAALGITRIVVAHRAETIAAAEAVYEMRAGRLHRVR